MKISVFNMNSAPESLERLARLLEGTKRIERFWLGEIHSRDAVSDAFLMCLLLASSTKQIKFATAALSLNIRNPYLLSQSGFLAQWRYPGRIGIGVTGGQGAQNNIIGLLRTEPSDGVACRNYETKLKLLNGLLYATEEAFLKPPKWTLPSGAPEVFVIGMSEARAKLAGQLGLPFVTSLHHGLDIKKANKLIQIYRKSYKPRSESSQRSHVGVVVSGFISEDVKRIQSVQDFDFKSYGVNAKTFAKFARVYAKPKTAQKQLQDLTTALQLDELIFLSSHTSYDYLKETYLNLAQLEISSDS